MGCVYQERSTKIQVKITKHVNAFKNYGVLTTQVKVENEKKLYPTLKSKEIVSFEQTSSKCIEIFRDRNNRFFNARQNV